MLIAGAKLALHLLPGSTIMIDTMATSTIRTSLLLALFTGLSQAFHHGLQSQRASFIAKESVGVLKAVSVDDLREESKIFVKDRNAHGHKRWGIDKENPEEYWFDQRIHTLGNVGMSGALHAALAPISTKLIDVLAYDGVDIRKMVACELSKTVSNGKARVVDLCCGVGISTRALREAFPEAESIIGIDTSPQMISMAEFLAEHLSLFKPMVSQLREQGRKMKDSAKNVCYRTLKFARANAEDTKLPDNSFDLVTIMYAFHEAPMAGRNRILEEARRILQPGGTLAVIDIATDYTPSPSMLAGEPYVIEYQKNIHQQLAQIKGFIEHEYKTLVPGHVGMWLLKRDTALA